MQIEDDFHSLLLSISLPLYHTRRRQGSQANSINFWRELLFKSLNTIPPIGADIHDY